MNEEQRALLLDVVGRYERNEEVSSTEYMTAYNAVFSICTSRDAGPLEVYKLLENIITRCAEACSARLDGLEGDELMRSYAAELSQYQTVTKKIISTFKYLDRFFFPNAEEQWRSENKNSLAVESAIKDESVYFQRIIKATMPPSRASDRDNIAEGTCDKEEEGHGASTGESGGSENESGVGVCEVAALDAPVVNMHDLSVRKWFVHVAVPRWGEMMDLARTWLPRCYPFCLEADSPDGAHPRCKACALDPVHDQAESLPSPDSVWGSFAAAAFHGKMEFSNLRKLSDEFLWCLTEFQLARFETHAAARHTECDYFRTVLMWLDLDSERMKKHMPMGVHDLMTTAAVSRSAWARPAAVINSRFLCDGPMLKRMYDLLSPVIVCEEQETQGDTFCLWRQRNLYQPLLSTTRLCCEEEGAQFIALLPFEIRDMIMISLRAVLESHFFVSGVDT